MQERKPSAKIFSRNLRYLRKKYKIPAWELAEDTGISESAILKWETEKAVPSVTSVMQIADYFMVKIDALIYDHLGDKKGKGDVSRFQAMPPERTFAEIMNYNTGKLEYKNVKVCPF